MDSMVKCSHFMDKRLYTTIGANISLTHFVCSNLFEDGEFKIVWPSNIIIQRVLNAKLGWKFMGLTNFLILSRKPNILKNMIRNNSIIILPILPLYKEYNEPSLSKNPPPPPKWSWMNWKVGDKWWNPWRFKP